MVTEARIDIPDTEPANLIAKASLMRQLIEESQGMPDVRDLAVQVARSRPPDDNAGRIEALRRYVARHFIWVDDPLDAEVFSDAGVTIRRGGGDCDDLTILAAALAESIGLKTRMVFGARDDGEWSHVWLEVFDGSSWVPWDPSEPKGQATSFPRESEEDIPMEPQNEVSTGYRAAGGQRTAVPTLRPQTALNSRISQEAPTDLLDKLKPWLPWIIGGVALLFLARKL